MYHPRQPVFFSYFSTASSDYKMETLERVIQIIDSNITYCLPYVVLTLILIRKIFSQKYPTQQALNLVRWYIVGYTIISTLSLILYKVVLFDFSELPLPYSNIYLIFLFCSIILPLSLLIRKLGNKYWYVFLVAIALKIGIYFERFVIIITSIHRDFITENADSTIIRLWLFGVVIHFIQGAIMSIILVALFNWIENKNRRGAISKSIIDKE